ncbi:MAG: serine/threonine protein phosphatase [Methylococcales bacterium]|nr:serine/threonine protein phosphatase [Methylococcales bacterium]
MKKLLTRINTYLKGDQALYRPGLLPGQRIYCIGDIHGRYDLLQQLHDLILLDASNYHDSVSAVYIGDYIDRGPQSKQVVDYLLSNPLLDFNSIFLQGNHEQVLLEFLHDPNSATAWFSFGGLSTLISYNIKITGIPSPQQLSSLQIELRENIPNTHIKFFQQLLPYYEKDGYYFVHAGVKPGVQLKKQRLEDMLWIRDKFLNSQRFHGKVIVHGHSITDAPDIHTNRIGIDTGAYDSNILTCLVLENDEKRFLSTTG